MGKSLKIYRTSLLTMAATALLWLIESQFNYRFPPTFLILFVMFAAFYDGLISTLVCALVAWAYYAYYLSVPGQFFVFEKDNGQRFLILGLVLCATMALGYILRSRSLAGLQKALDKLKSSEELMRGLIESAHDAFIAINSTGHIINWNRQAEKTFGWSEKEVLGKVLAGLIIPERYREMHTRGLERFMQTGTGPVVNKRFELSGLHRDGHEFPIEITIYPFKQGQDYYFGSFLQDISERKKSQQIQAAQFAVTNILTDYNSLHAAAPKLIEVICLHIGWTAGEFWLKDGSGRLRCESFWHLPHADVSELRDVTLKASIEIGKGLPGRVWQTREPVWIEDISTEFNFPRMEQAAKSNIHRAVGFPIMAEDEILGVMGFYNQATGKPDQSLIRLMSDIGKRIGSFIQRRLAEDQLSHLLDELENRVELRTSELAESNSQLAAANRLKDEFLATVSHELRTPLNVMQGHSELLLARFKFEPQVTESLNAIYRNAKSQGHIINDLLDVSRIITGKLKLAPAKIDMSQVVKNAVESIAIAAKAKNIEIEEKIDLTENKFIFADADRFQQVLWNLLTNAVKFTPNGGKITVDLADHDSRVTICVTDTGIGIEPAFLPYVFERFRQEDSSSTRKHGGLGLGMAIARHITELHGGVIQAFSSGKDKGSTFKITFPAFLTTNAEHDAKSKSDSLVHLPANELGLAGKNILVVEDEADTLQLLQIMLEGAGAQVTTAKSAEDALRIKAENSFDLLLSDIGMPGQDGYQLVKKFDDTPAIALTAYANDADRSRALAAGFKRHLTKPVESAELLSTVKDVLLL